MQKLLIDLFPVIVLFIIYKITNDMIAATKMAMAASVMQMLFLKIKKMPIKAIHWFGLGMVLVLGSLTIYLSDPFYIKVKFTVVEWILAIIILVSQFVFRKNALQSVMGSEMPLPREIWDKLALRMALFFIFIGALNLLVMYYFRDNDNAWLNFKLFVSTGLMFVFFLFQYPLLKPYLLEKSEE